MQVPLTILFTTDFKKAQLIPDQASHLEISGQSQPAAGERTVTHSQANYYTCSLGTNSASIVD